MKKKNLMAALLSGVMVLGSSMTAFAGANCPYCDTECVVQIKNFPDYCSKFKVYKGGIDGVATGEGRRIYHAELLYDNEIVVQKDGKLTTEDGPVFDGTNVYYLRRDNGHNNREIIYNAANDTILEKYIYRLNNGTQIIFDFRNGQYHRFDGNVYNFDPSLFIDTASKDLDINDYKFTIWQNDDLRFMDWMCVNNSELPQPIIDRLTYARDLYKNTEYLSQTTGVNAFTEEYCKEYYENLEVAVEMICGLIPIDGQ